MTRAVPEPPHNNEMTPEETAVAAEPSLLRSIVGNPLGLVSLLWLVAVLLLAILAPLMAPYSPTKMDFINMFGGPTWSHPFGTDQLGRDILTRLIFGAWPSVQAVLVATAVYVAVGLPLGLAAGYYGGLADLVVSRFSEMLQTLPGLILLLVVLAVFGNNMPLAMLALGLLAAPSLIRVTRAVTLSVREELFISAAKVFGLSDLSILVRHILPRIRSATIVQTALFSGAALMVQSSLAFLGFGPQPPNPTWGGMIGEASRVVLSEPWQIVPAGLVIGITVMALGLIGNAVRDAVSEAWSSSYATLLQRTKGRPKTPRQAGQERTDALIKVRDLTVSIARTRIPIVRSVDFEIAPGEAVGVVGESGCGKSLMSLGLIGVLPPGAALSGGAVYLDGSDLSAMSSDELDRVRGRRIGYVSQDPALALDPMFTVGSQLREAVRRHCGGTRKQNEARSLKLLSLVHLAEPEAVARRYPHELSGGMAQRVCIALALAGDPELLIADEPTTALDVTTQAEILALLRKLKAQNHMAALLVTHDWGVVAELCDRALVMYAGQVVESGPVGELFENPQHPYTAALLAANPHIAVEYGLGSQTTSSGRPQPLPTIPGTVPLPVDWSEGCTFAPRCGHATPSCTAGAVPLIAVGPRHHTRCLHNEDVRPIHLRGSRQGAEGPASEASSIRSSGMPAAVNTH